MRIKITQPGLYDGQGREIPIGTEFTLDKEPTDWKGRYDVTSGSEDDKEAILNADMGEAEIGDTDESAKTQENLRGTDGSKVGETTVTGSFKVEETSPGWYVVTKGGETATKKFRKAELEGFDAMSDADKAAFVDQNKAEA